MVFFWRLDKSFVRYNSMSFSKHAYFVFQEQVRSSLHMKSLCPTNITTGPQQIAPLTSVSANVQAVTMDKDQVMVISTIVIEVQIYQVRIECKEQAPPAVIPPSISITSITLQARPRSSFS